MLLWPFIFTSNIIIIDFLYCSSIHACVLVKALLRNFSNQEKCPPELYRQSSDMNSMVASVAGEIEIYSVFLYQLGSHCGHSVDIHLLNRY